MNGISIIIPVHNEEKSISEAIEQIKDIIINENINFEIIVVDDGSTDNSRKILDKIKDIVVLNHDYNSGYGAALKTGICYSKFEYILITDADGTYPMKGIPRLIKTIKGHSMVVCARVGDSVKIPTLRRPAKWLLNKLADYLSNNKIPDLNSGLRIINKDIYKKYFHLLPDGFSFTTTITLAMLCGGEKVKYIPIDYYPRKGKSKIRPIRDTINFFQLIIRTVMYFNPLRIFLPLSSVFIFSGIFMILYRLFNHQSFGVTYVLLFIIGFQILAIGMLADLIDKKLK